MGAMANICKPKEIIYITEGKIISLNFRDENGDMKKISIHEGNILRKAIEMYQEAINKSNSRIIKVVYEPDQTKLSLNKKISELNINFNETIIVYLK